MNEPVNKLNVPLILALIIIPSLFGIFKMPTEMGIIAGAIAIALAFNNLEKFVKFKGIGFEAELRTAVDKTYAALDQLRSLALAISEPVVDEMAHSGRIGTVRVPEKVARVENIARQLKQLGAGDAQIKTITATAYRLFTIDHKHAIYNALEAANSAQAPPIIRPRRSAFFAWDAGEIESFIKKNELKEDAEIQEKLKDLTYFFENHKLRRPEAWVEE